MADRGRKRAGSHLYAQVNNVSRKVKRSVVKTLAEESLLWGESSQDCNEASPTSGALCLDTGSSIPVIIDNGVKCSYDEGIGDAGGEKNCADAVGEDFDNADSAEESGDDRCFGGPCDNDEATELVAQETEAANSAWNSSFQYLPEELINFFEPPTSSFVGQWVSVEYDCDICINCHCNVCDTCQHVDGVSCKHCERCILFLDSDSESAGNSSSSSSDAESGIFSLDPSVLRSEDENKNEEIRSTFVDIVLEQDASHVLVDKLLEFFRANNFGNFPKTAKTLLKTPIVTKVRPVPPGEYWHRGLDNDLLDYIIKSGCSNVKLSFSVDGVPVAKSAGTEFYPIGCSFNDSKEVVLAGVYCGKGKPQSSDVFLQDFVAEVNELVEKGIDYKESHVTIEVHLCICDAVAKAWLLNVKGHSGYFSCCKCTVEGVYVAKRVVFLDQNCPKRTDDSFNSMRQEDHHNGPTILSSLKTFKPVTNTVLDYMHLILLGVFRKIFYLLIGGPMRVRQSASVIGAISNVMLAAREWVPNDFARKCRSLEYVKRFKATEWRMMLLYLIPLFQSHLPKALFEHLLVLHVAVRIICSTELIQTYIDYADELMKYFVNTFVTLYGKLFVSHNVHNLVHLIDDCRKHGVVDKFSAFKFENFYQVLKKMIRKGEKPLQQLARRYQEQVLKKPKLPQESLDGFRDVHTNGPLPPWCINPQYYRYNLGSYKLNLSKANNCCALSDGSVVVIENFAVLKNQRSKVIIGRKYSVLSDLYTFPCNSSRLGIYFGKQLSDLTSWPVEMITKKCFRVPFKNGFAIFPLLH